MRQLTYHRRLIAFVILLLVVFSACAPSSSTPAGSTPGAATPNPRGQQLILWYGFGGTQEAALLQLVDDFNQHNEWGIAIAAERIGDGDALRAKALAADRHGALPDLAVADTHIAADFLQASVSVALDPYVSDHDYGLGQSDLNDMLPGAGDAGYNNEIISWPIGREIVVLAYNVKWLNSIGLQAPPSRWSEFRDISCAVLRDADGDGAYDHFGYEHAGDVTTLMGWLHSRGTRVISADGQRAEFGSAQGLDTFTLLRDLFDNGCAQQAEGPEGARAQFAAGRALFAFVHSSELTGYEQAVTAGDAFPVGIAPMPGSGVVSPTVPLTGPDAIVFRTTPSRQLAAWLFARYLGEPEQNVRWAEMTGQFPVRQSAASGARMQKLFAEHPLLAAAWALMPRAAGERSVPGWQAVSDILAKAMQDVVDRRGAIDAIVSDAVARANDALARP